MKTTISFFLAVACWPHQYPAVIAASEPQARLHLKLTEHQQQLLDSAREDVGKKVAEGTEEVRKLQNAVNDARAEFKEWKTKKIAEQQHDVANVIKLWNEQSNTMVKDCAALYELQNNNTDAKCAEMKTEALESRDTALKELKVKLSADFSTGMTKYVDELSSLVLMGDEKKLKLQQELDYIIEERRQYVYLDPLFLEDDEKRLEYYLACADEVVTDVSGEIAKIKKVLVGDVCLEFIGIDTKVNPEDEAKFNENFAAALEMAYSLEGMEMNVISVSILEQYVGGEEALQLERDNDYPHRLLSSGRSLRMKVGARYQCFCDTGYDAPTSDVAHRRNLFERELWNSEIAETFGSTLTLSCQTIFEDLLTVESFDCAEMETRVNEEKRAKEEEMKKISHEFAKKVDGMIEHAKKEVDEFKYLLEKYTDNVELKKQKRTEEVRRKIEETVGKWKTELQKVEGFCKTNKEDGKSDEECRETKKQSREEKSSEILSFREKFAEEVKKEREVCTKELTDIGLKGHALIVSLHSWLKYGFTANTEFEREVKDLEFQIAVLSNLLQEIIKKASKARSTNYGNVCLEFTGVSHTVRSEKKDEFTDRFAVGLEFAFASEGVDANVFGVKILNQSLAGSRRDRRLQNMLRNGRSGETAAADADVLHIKLSTSYDFAFGTDSNLVAGEESSDLFEVMGEDFAFMLSHSFHAVFEDIVSVEPVACSTLKFTD